jgi:hypothetical protein
MDFVEYLGELLLIMKTSKAPINEMNVYIGLLRLQDIELYEPCLQYAREKARRKRLIKNNSRSLVNRKEN